ncbi:MAG: hypothetical protein KDB68_07080 [Planctomycetes bacterium]|nr:hypothetical protein [Planctomycetota bacterium]MCA8935953.1 hypothetical protein [Planctomycetota bacterium]MCA8946122.1 hypothetical protein [Planctomycetota bacterium]
MKNLGRNALSMLGIAAVTMVASLAVLGPIGADAEDPVAPKTAEDLHKITPVISTPSLKEDDCTVLLKADKETYVVGDKPILSIEVTNNSKEAIEKTVTVSMESRSLIEGGRMPAMARVVWTETTTVSLAAGETKTVSFETETAIEDMNATSFLMSGGSDEVSTEAKLEKELRRVVRNSN